MLYLLVIILLFLLTASSSLFKIDGKRRDILFFVCWLLCFCIAAFREIGADNDSMNYFNIFSNNYHGVLVEKSFHVISSFVKFCCGNDFMFVLFIYALIGVSAKFLAIKQLTNLWLLSCVIYIANVYLVQDITQIRVGVATGMLLLSIKPLYDRDWKRFLIFAIIGTLFHFAAIIIFFLWFLNPNSFNKSLYIALILVSYCIFFMDFTITELVSVIPSGYVQEKLKLNYEASIIKGEMITPFTIMQSLRLAVAALAIWKLDRIVEANRFVFLLLKIYIIGIASFVLFTDIPAFSLRITEFVGVVEVVLIPLLMYTFKNERIGVWLPIGIGVFLLFMNLFVFNMIVA